MTDHIPDAGKKDLQQSAERVARVRETGDHIMPYIGGLCMMDFFNDCELLAHAYLDLRAEILLACLEESTYDGLHARIMTLHGRGE